MVQQFALWFYDVLNRFADFLQPIMLWVVLLVGFATILALVFYLRDKEGFEHFRESVSARLTAVGIGLVALLLLVLEVLLLNFSVDAVVEQRKTEAASPYTTGEEAPVGTLYQFGPVAAYLREQTYTRDYVLPVQLGQAPIKEGAPPTQSLLPYLREQVPYAAKAPKVEVIVRRVGEEWVVTRKVTMLEEVPVTIDRAEITARFQTRRDAKGRFFYRLTFGGQYTFRNPLDSEAQVRFVFPLPEPPGTIEGFQLKVGDNVVTEPNQYGQYAWEGKLPPGASVTAVVQFQAAVGEGWHYDIGSGRRRTGDFQLVVDSDSPPRLLRRSLAPTERRGSRAIWQLHNVITSQQVALAFPADTTAQETLLKVLSFYPIALIAFGTWSVLLALLGALRIAPVRWLFAVLGMGVGFLTVPVLLSYITLGWAALVGSAIASALGVWSLKKQYAPLAVLPSASPLAFLVTDHSALLLTVLILLALISLWRDIRHKWSL